jgi:hypothetical protein
VEAPQATPHFTKLRDRDSLNSTPYSTLLLQNLDYILKAIDFTLLVVALL